jgi:hypothetical protein
LAKNLIELLESYALKRKIIIYVKDEGSNLNTMTIALKSIVSCDMLGLEESFQGNCFGHAFLKLANMLQQRNFFVDFYNMCQSSCQKKLERVDKNAKRHM